MTNFTIPFAQLIAKYEQEYVRFHGHEVSVALSRLTRLQRLIGADSISLSQADVERFLQSMSALQPSSRNRFRALLGHLLKWGQGRGLVEGPLPSMSKERENNERTRRLSPEEEEQLLKVMDPDFRLWFWGALDTGLRFSAQKGLRGQDVRDGVIVVPAKIQKHRQAQLIPLTNRLKAGLRPEDGEPLFPPIPLFKRRWMVYREQAGCLSLHWHDLRGEFASRLSEKGVPIDVISRLLGHTSLETTQRYLRPRVAQYQDAIAALGV